MKLVISKGEFDKRKWEIEHGVKVSAGSSTTTERLDDLDKTFEVLDPKIKNKDNRWDTYSTKNFSKDPAKREVQMNEFIYYFCGYLQYYDQVVRGGFIDHSLYLDWDSKPGHVVVYIDPMPVRKVLEPEFSLSGTTTTAGSSDPVSPKPPPPPYH